MNQLIDIQENLMLSSKWKQILLMGLLGLYAALIKWRAFGFIDFSELVWLGAVLILSIAIGKSYFTGRPLTPGMAIVFGVFCWSLWHFFVWVFVDRVGLTIRLIGIVTTPIRNILGMDAANFTILGLTIISILLSLWGVYWIYKNFDVEWLRKVPVYWLLLLTIIAIVGIYSGQQPYKDNCFGLNAYSSSLFCKLQNNLGVIGTILVTLIFITWTLTFTLQQANSYGTLAILWIIALTPVWIEIFFNPVRILSVILFKEIRTPGDGIPVSMLEANMQLLNLLPIVIFFVLIPVGLIFLNTEKSRMWWIISTSTITFAVILIVLFRSLDIGKPLFSYSNSEQINFIFMALQLWLPSILGIIIINKPHMRKLTTVMEKG